MKMDVFILLFGWIFAGVLVYGFFYDVIHFVSKANAQTMFSVEVVERCDMEYWDSEVDGIYVQSWVCKL